MQTSSDKQSIVYSQPHCTGCVRAKTMLKEAGYAVEERIIDREGPWTKEYLLSVVPNARSVPQIFINDKYIGGLKELCEYFSNKQ